MKISLDLVESQHFVGRLKLIELLERQSPYRDCREPVERRFSQALKSIPPDFQQAALAIFASTFYLNKQMLDDGWRYLWSVLNRASPVISQLKDLLILELDRDLLRDEFYRANSIVGRLQDNLPWKSTHDIIDAFMNLENGQMAPELKTSFRDLMKRRLWILLMDLSISGTSAVSELDRLHKIRSLFLKDTEASIVALIQVATHQAIELLESSDYTYYSAIKIPISCALNTPSYDIITDLELQQNMRDLCRWFAENQVLSSDYRLAKMSKEENDPDIAAFGFGKAGWNIVTYKNTPNNSLPIFWFRPPGDGYRPPFERIDSRIGPSWSGRRDWLRRAEQDSDLQQRVNDALIRGLAN